LAEKKYLSEKKFGRKKNLAEKNSAEKNIGRNIGCHATIHAAVFEKIK